MSLHLVPAACIAQASRPVSCSRSAPTQPPVLAPRLSDPFDVAAELAPRPLLDRWFQAWAERAEARWCAAGGLRGRYY